MEIWPDGTTFKGNYMLGKKNGFGKLQFADSSFYEGQFKDNEIEGIGKYVWPD